MQHINEFSEIYAKLAEHGIEILNDLLVIMLLASLPSEFENFVIAMETKDQLRNFNVLKQKKEKEEKKEMAVAAHALLIRK